MAGVKRVRRKTSTEIDHPEVNKNVKVTRAVGGGSEVILEEERKNDRLCGSRPSNHISEDQAIVGLSKGCTRNMGNYESARIDVSLTVICKNNEVEIMNTLADISQKLDEQLEFEVSSLVNE